MSRGEKPMPKVADLWEWDKDIARDADLPESLARAVLRPSHKAASQPARDSEQPA